jgi:hypothetical protein
MPGLPDGVVDLVASRAKALAAAQGDEPEAVAALQAVARHDWVLLRLAAARCEPGSPAHRLLAAAAGEGRA